MATVLESVMLICFGLSWPISVYKSIRTRSTQGKSAVFLTAILLGYLAGIASKLIRGDLSYVLTIYLFNFCVVSTDLVLYWINRRREQMSDPAAIV